MIQRVMERIKIMVGSRYAHLGLALFALYGVSWFITHTSRFEKVMDTFKWYCYADYEARTSMNSREVREAEFYREKYREKFVSLAKGSFDYRDKKETQAFFLSKGFLYDVWDEKSHPSYLLARVIEKGRHKAEIPEEVAFDYFILGDKKVAPFPEYKKGDWTRDFVSAGEKKIYIHGDSLEPLLRGYFGILWNTQPREPNTFYNDALTHSLYRDLEGICEDLFVKRLYTKKQRARDYFMKEGFHIFLPTLFAMGARMAADLDSNLPPDDQYLRACLTGLSSNPNHTMAYLLKVSRPESHHPRVMKGWGDFRRRLNLTHPDRTTLVHISKAARETLDGLEASSTVSQ
ncbi:MAG TPA: hypothetical protein VLZ10_02530 [Thermodesulfobacteriota bacterium]|nr:hypothetical protein [Thermodesulfobacteriota bacterium]